MLSVVGHVYEFFDRTVVDPLWGLSWASVLEHHHSKWFRSKKMVRGEYLGTSLRELIGFAIDPEPSDPEIDNILSRMTVRATIRRSNPQFWVISVLMDELVSKPKTAFFSVELEDVSGLIAVATRAFLERRITAMTLWSVAKLHSSSPSDWLRLDPEQMKAVDAALPRDHMNNPIYSWQGKEACTQGEWTNCLGVALTRRFAGFVTNAHLQDWPAAPLKEDARQTRRRFADFPDCVDLAKRLERRFAALKRPSVTRMWE
jgi:hypothetical protein